MKENRKTQILDQALNLTSLFGLEALTIGQLAKEMEMSKSGLFAHFQSKENLQIAVLDHAAESFQAHVTEPALAEPRGIPRIEALLANWLLWYEKVLPGGCPFLGALFEFDDREGPVRDHLMRLLAGLHEFLVRMAKVAKEEGHLRRETDEERFAFEFFSLVVGGYHYLKVLKGGCPKDRIAASLRGLIQGYATS